MAATAAVALLGEVAGAGAVTAAAPANDNFAAAQTVGGSTGSVSGTNTGATTEPGEPGLYPSGGGGMGNTIWYAVARRFQPLE